MKKYTVRLAADERNALQELVRNGKGGAKKLAHARILLKADQADGSPGWTDEQIARAVDVSRATVERVRQRFVEQGFEAALVRKPQDRPSRERKLDGAAEARLIAVACSAPPDGRARWTLKMLADELVALEVVEAVSDETVRRGLKKTSSSRTAKSRGSSRRARAGSSSPGWRTCRRSITGRTASAGRSPVSTRCRCNGSASPARRCRRGRANRGGSTTSTSGTGRRTCSWGSSRCSGGGG
jgi:transposase